MDNSVIYQEQRFAEIPPENRRFFLEEIEPKNEGQRVLIEKLIRLARKEYKTLLISGNKGTGKTFLALAFLNSAIYRTQEPSEFTAKYVTHYELDLRYKAAMNDSKKTQADIYNQYAEYSYLVIDELGRGSITDYSMTFIENLISRRYSWSRPTVIITNKTTKELKELLDAQMLDRLGNEKQETFALDGESLR